MQRTEIIHLAPNKGMFCPICNNDHGCAILPTRDAVICLRVEQGCQKDREGRSIAAENGMGWLHSLKRDQRKELGERISLAKKAKRLTHAEILLRHKHNITAVKPERLERLGAELGISVEAMRAYDVGWDDEMGAFSFPMMDGNYRIVGLQYRYFNGVKMVLEGCGTGLFIPNDYTDAIECAKTFQDPPPMIVLVPEGVSDCCAIRDLGFRAVGRYNSKAGLEDLKTLIRCGDLQHVVIVADRDETKYDKNGYPFWPGQEAALWLCNELLNHSMTLRMVKTPVGIKDVREWLGKGATSQSLQEIIDAEPRLDKIELERMGARLTEMKRKMRKTVESEPEPQQGSPRMAVAV